MSCTYIFVESFLVRHGCRTVAYSATATIGRSSWGDRTRLCVIVVADDRGNGTTVFRQIRSVFPREYVTETAHFLSHFGVCSVTTDAFIRTTRQRFFFIEKSTMSIAYYYYYHYYQITFPTARRRQLNDGRRTRPNGNGTRRSAVGTDTVTMADGRFRECLCRSTLYTVLQERRSDNDGHSI